MNEYLKIEEYLVAVDNSLFQNFLVQHDSLSLNLHHLNVEKNIFERWLSQGQYLLTACRDDEKPSKLLRDHEKCCKRQNLNQLFLS